MVVPRKKGIDLAMIPVPSAHSLHLVIVCPICGFDGPTLRHDIRASLLYFCERCEHEWQIAPEDEPAEMPAPAAAATDRR